MPDPSANKFFDVIAAAILVLALAACAGLALFGIWWTAEFDVSFWAGALSMGPALAIGSVVAVVLFQSRAARMSGAVSIVAAGVAVLAAEIYLASSTPEGNQAGAPVVEDRDSARRNKTRMIPRIDGLSTFPAGFPRAYIETAGADRHKVLFRRSGKPFLPLGGMPNAATVFCDEGYGTVVYRSDRNGFRNPDAVWDPSDVPVVAAIGDSYTEGECVQDGESYVDRLRGTWPRLVNLGKRGNGPLLELAALKEYLPRLRPRLVLWFFCENNDYADLATERRVPLLMRYLNDPGFSQGLASRRKDVSLILGKFLGEGARAGKAAGGNGGRRPADASAPPPRTGGKGFARLKDILFLRHLRSALGWFHVRLDPDLHDLYRQVMGEAKRTVESWGGELVVVMIPGPRLEGTLLKTGYSEAHSQAIIRMIERHDIRVIDPAAALRRVNQPIYPPKGNHFSPYGNAVIARVVLQALANRPR